MTPRSVDKKLVALASVAVLGTVACGSSSVTVEDACMTEPLPLVDDASGPTITDVGLEIQPGEGVIVVATATHPDGTAAFDGVMQSVGVFPDSACAGLPIIIQDDLAGSGLEETFGTVVSATDDSELFDAIQSREAWPVEVDFRDIDGKGTTGRVLARVIR